MDSALGQAVAQAGQESDEADLGRPLHNVTCYNASPRAKLAHGMHSG